MTLENSTVLVFGATGHTGSSIINGLLAYQRSKVIAVVRPSSAEKPSVVGYKSKGVEIRTFDLDSFGPTEAEALFQGVDVVIAAFQATHIHIQYPLIDAAKKVGVKRFVPCDWGTSCVKGVREMFDQKLEVREYLKASGVGYTYIDVGWWVQLLLPAHKPEAFLYTQIPEAAEWLKEKFGNLKSKTAVIDNADIGHFVARIVVDPQTLGRYVFCWGEEIDQETVIKTVEELSPTKIEFKYFTEEELKQTIAERKAAKHPFTAHWEYQYSLWIREDNLIEKAKRLEYGNALDAKELYPDVKTRSFRQVAQEFYSK